MPPDADSYNKKGVGEAGRAVAAEYDLILLNFELNILIFLTIDLNIISMGKDQQLLEAARNGDIKTVGKLLDLTAKRHGPLSR